MSSMDTFVFGLLIVMDSASVLSARMACWARGFRTARSSWLPKDSAVLACLESERDRGREGERERERFRGEGFKWLRV